jgi:hypothetical protein
MGNKTPAPNEANFPWAATLEDAKQSQLALGRCER